ncbi:MAG: DUF6580 family putative transport protein [Patescibacteria group bacterium]
MPDITLNLSQKLKQTWRQLPIAATVLISRFNYLPANFSPLGSFGFFSQNFFLYFVSIIIFDIIKSGFYQGFVFTYLGFLAYYLFGKLAANNLNKQMLFLPLASLSFFLLSNLGSWWLWYQHDFAGLAQCYLLALPFYRNTLLGDLFFGYGYLLMKKTNFFSLSLSAKQRLTT